MYLIDTDVISENRKGALANAGVRTFFASAVRDHAELYVSAVTLGELRQGVENIRHRGDGSQAARLERWLTQVTGEYADAILAFDAQIADIWGRLRAPHAENPMDKQIAATALIHGLTVVTRNSAHYRPTGVRTLNPFS